MTMHPNTVQQLTQESTEALRRGDGASARAKLQEIIKNGPGMPKPWFLMAQACHLADDAEGEDNALEQLLTDEPRHLVGLLMKGVLKAKQGDSRAAASFYRTALNVAAQLPQIPQTIVPMLQKAEAHIESSSADYEDFLLAQLEAKGVSRSVSPRFDQSLDLLLGKNELYLQQPSVFYFPGLPQRAFYEREEFSWIADMEAQIPALQHELQGVLQQKDEFAPYVKINPERPLPNNALLNDPSWGAYYFWENGVQVEEHAEQCPVTMEALTQPPLPIIKERSPIALYSLLKPGTHIKPHHGVLNTRLICHIPLITHDKCALRVGSETRRWEDGKALIFDDSFEHEAWNRGDSTRIILLFEVWRPEITEEERVALTAIFEAISYYDAG
ncbi:aspartyl/asparaginyl beta-hydroxylase domain-containing protein [Sphingorhabdus sp. Alg239-R122]|uniref:aspartyl/asparaginyl beta-hydroxylase domain-containing protein n=1 Tax=Sphingorhabdus sp. Alg239-R122 TaxID=2305989 RepID=UPI001F078232|nr:aspartyl/asparaginyl beta-hydroxylase domain-containing protein [Sphingorhabdus sp. Alg239-R122]